MVIHGLEGKEAVKFFDSDQVFGLNNSAVIKSRQKYGANELTGVKKKSLFKRILEALSEPMLIILEFAWVITVGVNLGKFIKSGDGDIYECLGILFAIAISVTLTIVMEGRSEKAFELLQTAYDNFGVKIIRNGEVELVERKDIVVGDIILLESGDKVAADGRLLETVDFSTDESMLTGESRNISKDAHKIYAEKTLLAERKNMVYSGTFVVTGTAKMIATAVGNEAEMGKIAGQIREKSEISAPLQEKLNRLGKIITIIGGISAGFVFILSVVRLALINELSFINVQDVFVEAIVLIVAAVPEGLPTTVAISLTLNVLKLAKSDALIRKLVAAETIGAVSVICSDKTGTLTQNKMTVQSVCTSEFCYRPETIKNKLIIDNIAVNSTADLRKNGKDFEFIGSGTECALLAAAEKNSGVDYRKMRNNAVVLKVKPFSSADKYMKTSVKTDFGQRILVKGAPEIILDFCALNGEQKNLILNRVSAEQRNAKRVIGFAHADVYADGREEYDYDGYAVITDPLRPEVKDSVAVCRNAGISVKMLTGDNISTAGSIARELNIINSPSEVVSADMIDNLPDEKLSKALNKITVIARSTPTTKLKVVNALKKSGEVVAVTGDGVNDAPAIKNADIGIAMGSGSEITKEAADIVLLNDSFSTIVKAISFGRNIYENFQRFIAFQLSVNLSAMLVVIGSLLIGLKNPFNALQLLWINIIMDGPPALTLGLETRGGENMNRKPIKRSAGIVTARMLLRIIFNGIFIGGVILCQYLFNFLNVDQTEKNTAVFTLFIVFQLFNAFNCRELGGESILKNFTSNKIMLLVFAATFVLQILLSELCGNFFETVHMSLGLWIKICITALSVIIISETYKAIYRYTKIRQKILKLRKKFLN